MTSLHSGPTAGDDSHSELLLTDFTSASPDLGWYVVNDNVMGGRSDGGFEVQKGELLFAGRTNTRGGGFSSIRSGRLALDLSDRNGIRVRVKGDGRRYTWRLTTGARIYGREIAYWADFDTADGAWQSIDIPFSSFVPRFRGAVLDGPPLDTREITGMGLMIYDKRDGPFELRPVQYRAAKPRHETREWYVDGLPGAVSRIEVRPVGNFPAVDACAGRQSPGVTPAVTLHADANPVTVRQVERKPSAALELHIANAHWIDASSGSLEEHVDQLARSLKPVGGDWSRLTMATLSR